MALSGKLGVACTNLAAITVTGVLHNYNVDAAPESFSRAQLPALVVIPSVSDSIREKFGDFVLETPVGSKAIVAYVITHLLLVAPTASGRGSKTNYPTLVDLTDLYATAIRANPTLTAALFRPTVYAIGLSPQTYGGIEYIAARFWHKFIVETT